MAQSSSLDLFINRAQKLLDCMTQSCDGSQSSWKWDVPRQMGQGMHANNHGLTCYWSGLR